MRPRWYPDWSMETAAIVASGPSAAGMDLKPLARARVIAVNNSLQLWPRAEALYAADRQWWDAHRGEPEFSGLKITQDLTAAHRHQLHQVTCLAKRHEILTDTPGTIGGGGNGGFQALNLAVQFGARRILLIGFDMHLAGGVHWHPDHPAPLNNPTDPRTFAGWRQRLEAIAPRLQDLGVEVINCTPGSALTAYPNLPLEQALAA